MIAVVVPVHNEEKLIADCLHSIRIATRDEALREPVLTIVVLDDCTDRSECIARKAGVIVLKTTARCVGLARATGAAFAIARGARWIACTDADSRVPRDWIFRQLRQRADLVCGIVSVADWSLHATDIRHRYDLAYQPVDGHHHIHGANLGCSAKLYQKIGGFSPLRVGEDVALVEAAEKVGARIAWVADPCVVTDARIDFRAPDGFGAYILALVSGSAALAKAA